MASELKAIIAQRYGKSYLQQAYCTQPFKLTSVGEDQDDPTLYLMVRSSSPGILDGDDYHLEINLQENCRLCFLTPSYQRIFKMEKGASQRMVVNLAADSHFNYIPHPLVPHENAIFNSQNLINMAKGASLIWGEIITCGRKLSGEKFKFTYLRNMLEVYRCGKLVFKEQLLLCPQTSRLSAIGQLEQYTHQATLLFLHETALISPLTDLIQDYLKEESDLTAGVSQTAPNGLVVRILGNSGEQLYRCLQEINLRVQELLT